MSRFLLVPIPKIYARSKKKKLKPENDKDNGRQVCEECGKSVRNLKDHAVQHQPKSERRKLPCKVCPKVFTNYSARSRHYKIKHLGLKKKCDICDKGKSNSRTQGSSSSFKVAVIY